MPMIAFLSELKRNHNKLTDKLIELKLGGGGESIGVQQTRNLITLEWSVNVNLQERLLTDCG
jgi:hypothetical protein